MKEYYYKIVDFKNKSAFVGGIPGLSVNYKLNKWTYPEFKNSKLFIFKKIKNVKRWLKFFRYNDSSKIYKCEVKNPTIKRILLSPNFRDLEISIKSGLMLRFWGRKKLWASERRRVPRGTYVCDAVKLIEEV